MFKPRVANQYLNLHPSSHAATVPHVSRRPHGSKRRGIQIPGVAVPECLSAEGGCQGGPWTWWWTRWIGGTRETRRREEDRAGGDRVAQSDQVPLWVRTPRGLGGMDTNYDVSQDFGK
ncbi:hypothetical protein P152DRAFT_472972 [Eremomyces bilateralis CBS 781.70]|uniref:Uncharacterized protein n=1 Tax=Eremomyces bilateralis CBS 781.70 TaxID=1392243 RepID=A0A6G1G572_9PEZI|nr:uncharacterized protein P152DRAFT_472972 [Eremomyces bilateralis CBS 781.70]KAF1813227.1 hypothetical protein P152DRAFT_472972 [Eremomyces bilateralis CBS 781.70]